MSAPLLPTEEARLAELEDFAVLDTAPEQVYDDITLIASQLFDTPIALISLVDDKRQWFKSRVGLEVKETPRDLAFCAHAIWDPTQLLIVTDATRDDRFSSNPLVTSDPNIRFYAGAPLLTSSGNALGTLCVIDREPREFEPEQREALAALSRLVMEHFNLRRVYRELGYNLEEDRKIA